MTYVSDVEATFDLATRGGAEVLGQQPSVYSQCNAGDASRCGRAQEGNRTTYVFWRTRPTQGDGVVEFLIDAAHVRSSCPQNVGGVHVPWQDRIAANTVLAKVDSHALRQTNNPALAALWEVSPFHARRPWTDDVLTIHPPLPCATIAFIRLRPPDLMRFHRSRLT